MRRLLLLASLLLTACGDDPAPTTPAPEVEVPSWAKVAAEQIAEAEKHGVPVAFENDLGMRFVLIPAGTFLMGSPEDEEGRPSTSDLLPRYPLLDEVQHEVTVSRPFYMAIHEATNGQIRAWRPRHDSGEDEGRNLDGDRQPAVELSWPDAADFAVWLAEGTARSYRLPTEAAWEWACRAGTATPSWFGRLDQGPQFMNVCELCFRDAIARREADYTAAFQQVPDLQDGCAVSCPVGTFPANPWGLHEMHGNVREWCWDWLGPYPENGRAKDPWARQQGPVAAFGGAVGAAIPTSRAQRIEGRMCRS